MNTNNNNIIRLKSCTDNVKIIISLYDKLLSELVKRLFSEEIELKMYQFIKEVSLEWKPPSHITLQNIWNEEPQQNPEVQLVSEEELKDEKIAMATSNASSALPRRFLKSAPASKPITPAANS